MKIFTESDSGRIEYTVPFCRTFLGNFSQEKEIIQVVEDKNWRQRELLHVLPDSLPPFQNEATKATFCRREATFV